MMPCGDACGQFLMPAPQVMYFMIELPETARLFEEFAFEALVDA